MFLAISSSAQSMGMVIDSPAADIAQGRNRAGHGSRGMIR